MGVVGADAGSGTFSRSVVGAGERPGQSLEGEARASTLHEY